jgi:hypothetical protein
MTNSKIEIYLLDDNHIFQIYLRILGFYLKLGPLKIVNQSKKVTVTYNSTDQKNSLNFIRLLFKPYNFFQINRVVTNY